MEDSSTGPSISPKAHYGKITDQRLTADEMDSRRKENLAYEYLCHLEEAKVWIETCISEQLPVTTELEEGLRNGVVLAKLAHFMCPDLVPLKKVYDKDEGRYKARGLHFKHTDNINHFLKSLEDVGMPKIFSPETTDVYDRKNMPKTIYCIHALSLFLFKQGKAPQIQDLYGKIKFTDDEISTMRKELEKYGIQMPAFSKIGGILANEMPVDEAALHAAVIAINEAIDHQESVATLEAMKNPAALLVNIKDCLKCSYQQAMFRAKQSKAEVVQNKSLDPDNSYVPDIYDELLTQAEIQGNINKVNIAEALSQIETAVHKEDAGLLLEALTNDSLKLRDIKKHNIQQYMVKLKENACNKQNNNYEENALQSKEEVQYLVNAANAEANEEAQFAEAIKAINGAIDTGDADTVLGALKNPRARLAPVWEYAASLYHEELRNMKTEKKESLDYEEVSGGVAVLSAVAEINLAIEKSNAQETFDKMLKPECCIMNLDEGCKEKYQEALMQKRLIKVKQFQHHLLTHYEIQQCVNEINQHVVDENDRILAVRRINDAVDRGVAADTLVMLQLPSARLQALDPRQAVHYQNLLALKKKEKAEISHDATACLWYNDIQEGINMGKVHTYEGNHLSVGVASVNLAIDTSDTGSLLTCLCNSDIDLHSVVPECIETYLVKLNKFKEKKSKAGETGSGWMMNRLKSGHKFFFNVHTLEYAWERSDLMKKDYSLLTREEIQQCISEVTSAHDRQLLFQSNERLIIQIQAFIRGYLTRCKFERRAQFMKSHTDAIIKIQSWYRMLRVRRKYKDYLTYLKSNEESVLMIQAAARCFLARKKYLERLQFFKDHEEEVIKIQSFVRTKWAKNDFKMLMHGQDPPLSVVRRYVHLLDMGDKDYAEEIEIQKLKSQVVQEIRTNQQLERDLNQMDIKIGLLVKNRITLQDVVTHHKSLKNRSNHRPGIKALSKQSRERLEAYQNLFYLLQTNPVYLARLIFEMPQNQTNRFMESVILTLLNYASNQREEYLLLKLFKTALKEEIRCKVDRMSDIVTGNPMVVKMIVSFNRNARGQGSLRELLNPLVKKVIDDKSMVINTNPVEVYKAWVNQMESQSGKTSGMEYEVTPEKALEHQEVQERISRSVETLKQATEAFLAAILQNIQMIPYGMRYMAKVMRDALKGKFPQAAEKDILKIVGNLIYYRYINSAIVAPDAFDIIDVSAHKGLSTDQRRNLGSIAKILQFAASNKGFGGDSAHLASLNGYIMDAHNRFKKYFKEICEVEELEAKFSMDQYTDVTRVTKPVIYISVAEIIDTHKLLVEHEEAIAPDHNDPLHELLEDLGEVPSVESFMGECGIDENGPQNKASLAKTEISLTLSNKFEVPDEEKSDLKSLHIRTKRMVVEVVRCQTTGDNLIQILNMKCTAEEESRHRALVENRQRVDQRATKTQRSSLMRQQSLLDDTKLSLAEMKGKIMENLSVLEREELVTRRNSYQDLINSIVQDMRNQRLYRQRRRQEIVRLRNTLKSLGAKRGFFEEQVDYYNQYVKTCLENLSTKSKKSGRKYSVSKDKKPTVKGSIKYSGAKLHDKGVILEIEGLPTNQFKNVLFEITATETAGVFDVNARFMGVSMEKVELVFQDLLQLQYEGVAIMRMFDKAKVNVNLLIFLLNKKFYKK